MKVVLILNMETLITVIGSPTWHSSFQVQNTIVDTIDIFTYQCRTCDNSINCHHVKIVTEYVEKEMMKEMMN